MANQEVEFKYNASGISLEAFTKFCKERGKIKNYVLASGYDHFYAKSSDEDSFCRHRFGPDMNQVTFKRKTNDTNNFVRTEHNMNLKPEMEEAKVAALLSEFGYKFNTSIFKTCFVYQYDWYTFVYYICYNTEMQELGRFVEIEMSEDHAWENEEHTWNELLILEKLCKTSLGVTPQNRVKRSLYEMFKRS